MTNVIRRPVAETPPVGLTRAQVAERRSHGLANGGAERTSWSVAEILRANVLTRFNFILGVLLAVILVAGSGGYQATAVGADAYARKLAAEARRFAPVRSELMDGINRILRYVTDYLTRIAGCKYRNLAEPGPERQNGRVYPADFFEDRWRRYPHPSLSRGLLVGGGGSGRLGRSSLGRGGVSRAGQTDRCARGGTPGAGSRGRVAHA
jgi:hypothetical protein